MDDCIVSFRVGEVAGRLDIGPLAEVEVGSEAEVFGHVGGDSLEDDGFCDLLFGGEFERLDDLEASFGCPVCPFGFDLGLDFPCVKDLMDSLA